MTLFDYLLPAERIAQQPLADRAASKMLHLDRATGQVHHRVFRDCPSLLREGDLLVLNDTRVSAVRLLGQKPTGAAVEFFLLRDRGNGLYETLVKPGRRLRPGSVVEFEQGLAGRVEAQMPDSRRLVLLTHPTSVPEALAAVGRVPLPPYIHEELQDPDRYQTVYARTDGSSAAPTAGLHFTPEILDAIRDLGVALSTVTLDVGLDTFRPIEAENVDDHPMQGERCRVPDDTAEAVANCRGRVIAVGTTTVRTLETFARGPRRLEPGETVSKLFLKPGSEFQIVDGMFTNFHMPRTTMLLMLAALAGPEAVLAAYREALAADYRFLSFGDSMLVL